MRHLLSCSLLILFLAAAVSAQQDAAVEKHLAVLQSAADAANPDDKQLGEAAAAALKLGEWGTVEAVPALKKLLANEKLNTVVRSALINIPKGAGDNPADSIGVNTLRESLAVLKGKNLAGVIESLGWLRDAKSEAELVKLTKSDDLLVAQAAVLALGKIASEESVNTLKGILGDANSPNRIKAATGMLFAAEYLIKNGKKTEAAAVFETLKNCGIASVKTAAIRDSVLLDEEQGIPVFLTLLKSDDKLDVRAVLDIANKLKSPKTSRLILDNFGSLPAERKAALIEVIGVRKDPGSVEPLIQFAQSGDQQVKVAAVKALGNAGDLKGLDAILQAAAASDAALASAGNNSLMKIHGAEFNAAIVNALGSKEKPVRLAALNVIAARSITEGARAAQSLFNDSDSDIRNAAVSAFAQMVTTAGDLETLFGLYEKAEGAEKEKFREPLKLACMRISERDQAVAILEKAGNSGNTEKKQFVLELFLAVGGEKAGQSLLKAAKSSDNAVADKATELLGKWTTAEIAPGLLDLAKTLPVEKFRIRAVNGYIRIVRQLTGNLPPAKRLEMLESIEPLATREEQKKLVGELKERIQADLDKQPKFLLEEQQSKGGTAIFDGKTWEGWDFDQLGDQQKWWRIQDGAIVGGSLKEKVTKTMYVATKKEYGDFTLRLEAKITGDKGANGGVQFRSKRPVPGGDVVGYQADMTITSQYWGNLYGQGLKGRGGLFFAEAPDKEALKKSFKPNDWNEVVIVCKGDTVKISVNGVPCASFTETQADIPRKGIIGLQIHTNGPHENWYRNIRIEEE
ncbi:MAG: DUF1080 domain-containing protein [Planctomycetaceae bacterium]|nr:DUF1080 domain-containing protein [Planctomycetaceae bacterium]